MTRASSPMTSAKPFTNATTPTTAASRTRNLTVSRTERRKSPAPVTSAEDDMSSSLCVCLSVSNFAEKSSQRICIKFSAKVGNGPVKKWLNFGGDPDHRLDTGTGIVFRLRHYWEIRKVVITDINLLLY